MTQSTHNHAPLYPELTPSDEAEFLRNTEVEMMLHDASLASLPNPAQPLSESLEFLSTTTYRGQYMEVGRAGAQHHADVVELDPKGGGTLFISLGNARAIAMEFDGTRKRMVSQRLVTDMYGDQGEPQVSPITIDAVGPTRTMSIPADSYEFAKMVTPNAIPKTYSPYAELVKQGASDTTQYRELTFVARIQEILAAADQTPPASTHMISR